jgi:hypothetical protein
MRHGYWAVSMQGRLDTLHQSQHIQLDTVGTQFWHHLADILMRIGNRSHLHQHDLCYRSRTQSYHCLVACPRHIEHTAHLLQRHLCHTPRTQSTRRWAAHPPHTAGNCLGQHSAAVLVDMHGNYCRHCISQPDSPCSRCGPPWAPCRQRTLRSCRLGSTRACCRGLHTACSWWLLRPRRAGCRLRSSCTSSHLQNTRQYTHRSPCA